MASSHIKKDFHDQVAILEALLRLVTHNHPFQPALAASMDPRAWRAIFVMHCKALHDESLEVAANEELQRACRELHDFAATLYGAAHFARFDSHQHPEFDAVDFEPDDEFFETNQRWLQATAATKLAHEAITERLVAVDEHRDEACSQLSKVIFESIVGPKADLPAVLIEVSGTLVERDTLRAWLTPLPNSPSTERERRGRRIRLDALIGRLGPEQLIQIAAQVYPGSTGQKKMSAAIRSARQALRKKLQNAIIDVRASSHLQGGWEVLADFLTDAHALSAMVARIRRLAAPKNSRHDANPKTTGVILDSLRRLAPDVLDQHLRTAWWHHLEITDQLKAAVSSLKLIDEGYSAVGKNTLASRIKDDEAADKSAGWIDKADERLHALGVSLIAIHGSENWLHQPQPLSTVNPIRAPKAKQGWLINPLIALHPQVAQQLR